MIGKFVLILVLTVGGPEHIYFEKPGACLDAKTDMMRKVNDRILYIECFPTGRE